MRDGMEAMLVSSVEQWSCGLPTSTVREPNMEGHVMDLEGSWGSRSRKVLYKQRVFPVDRSFVLNNN